MLSIKFIGDCLYAHNVLSIVEKDVAANFNCSLINYFSHSNAMVFLKILLEHNTGIQLLLCFALTIPAILK